MPIKVVLLFLIFSSCSFLHEAHAQNCKDTIFKYIHNKEKVVLPLKVCKQQNHLMSKTCLKGKCTLAAKLKELKVSYSAFGSPHFNACHQLGYIPIIGKIKNVWKSKKRSWESSSFCFSKSKKDFVNSEYILKRIVLN